MWYAIETTKGFRQECLKSPFSFDFVGDEVMGNAMGSLQDLGVVQVNNEAGPTLHRRLPVYSNVRNMCNMR